MRIRAFVVDDERPARERLRQLLRTFEDVDVIGEAGDGEEAIQSIREAGPDLVFLDVQMPGRSGLEVAASLAAPRPSVVFCTAFDDYAIRAFELHAVDYLLKPVNRSRLAETVQRTRRSLSDSRELRQDLESARQVQTRLFPRALPQFDALDYSGACLPAKSVGGDYYDFLSFSPTRIGIALADVSGKGMAAGLLMASLQGRLQSRVAAYGTDVAGLMSELNREILRTTEGSRFITMFYGVYDRDRQTLTYVNAGHNPPLFFEAEMRRLECGGPLLGCLEGIGFEQEVVPMKAGDTLLAFSDGITEAFNANEEEFGEARLRSILESSARLTAEALRDRILVEVGAFTGGGAPHDDQTLVVVKVRGKP